MRKQIKFAMKRGDKLDDIKKKVFLVSSIVKEKHKTIVKVWEWLGFYFKKDLNDILKICYQYY